MYKLISKALFQLSPENAHGFSLSMLHGFRSMPGFSAMMRAYTRPDSSFARTVFGLQFNNPVGIAAGFDKNAEHVGALQDLGFGFVEIGSVTAQPAAGNPKPRLFRLIDDRAIINRMGLNNLGVEAIAPRLAKLSRQVPIFINVAKSHDSSLSGDRAVDDYVTTISKIKAYADVIVLNISCPNSGDGRTFEDPEVLEPLLQAVMAEISDTDVPLLVKVSPDLSDDDLDAVIDSAIAHGVAGFTATNTTVHRADLRTTEDKLSEIGAGGLSGYPLHQRALKAVRRIRSKTDLPIVGVGGIMGPKEANAFMEAGASLVQLYTGFIYGGPTIVQSICDGLVEAEPGEVYADQ